MFLNLTHTETFIKENTCKDKLLSQAKFNINTLFYEFLLLHFLKYNTISDEKGIFTLLSIKLNIPRKGVKKIIKNLRNSGKLQKLYLSGEGIKYLKQLTFIFESKLYLKR